jgi:aspartyl/asparaginyl beta-hydroxylase (cupin superfamily)
MMVSADGRTKELLQGAERALQGRDPRAALGLLREAERLAPSDIEVKMQLALALRAAGDLEAALAALDGALALEPYHLVALVSKGWLLEKLDRPREAAEVYRNALKIAPPDEQLAPGLRAPVARAREAVKAEADRIEALLLEKTQAIRARHPGERLDRFDLSLKAFAGKAKVFTPEPILMHFPKVPAEEYYDRALFPWLPQLEAATDMIREELLVVMREDLEELEPYIQYPPGVPVNQWVELNHSPRWNSYFLWRDGKRDEEHCRRCPNTAALLESLPMLDQPGFGPTAIFSVLAPHTRIPPHTGSANSRLVVHLPLILPGDCRFRVGNDTRDWRMGQAWVFDDTIEHEAWNDSDKTRVVLIFDTWNPFLTQAERELVSAMMLAKAEDARVRR